MVTLAGVLMHSPILSSVSARRGSFVLRCDEWTTFPGLTAVVGLNGAGKTSLLQVLDGRLKPASGSAENVGMFSALPQGATISARFTVFELFVYIAALRGVARRDRRKEVGRVLELCNLADKGAEKWHRLSGGWRQRALVGQCLLGGPDGVLLDEPTVSLDVAASRECWQLLKEVSGSIPVIVATHEASAAVEFSDRVVTVDAGVVSSGVSGDAIRDGYAEFSGSVESYLLAVLARPGATA